MKNNNIYKQRLYREFYIRIYQLPPPTRNKVCVYCGMSFNLKCKCNKEKRVLMQLVKYYNPQELQTTFEIFKEWSGASDKERQSLIEEYSIPIDGLGYNYVNLPPDNEIFQSTVKDPEPETNKLIPTQLIAFIKDVVIDNVFIRSQCSNWINSNSLIQRLIYYQIIIFVNDSPSRYEHVLLKIIDDTQTFVEMFKYFESLPKQKDIKYSKDLFVNIINRICENENNILQNINESIIGLVFLESPILSIDPLLFGKLISSLSGYQSFLDNVDPLLDKNCTIDQFKLHNIQDYYDIIPFCYYKYVYYYFKSENLALKILNDFHNHFKEQFIEFSINYLKSNIKDTNRIDNCIGIINYLTLNCNIDVNSQCDYQEFISQVIINIGQKDNFYRYYILIKHFNNIEPYYNDLIKSSYIFHREKFYSIYKLFHQMLKNNITLSKDQIKYYEDILIREPNIYLYSISIERLKKQDPNANLLDYFDEISKKIENRHILKEVMVSFFRRDEFSGLDHLKLIIEFEKTHLMDSTKPIYQLFFQIIFDFYSDALLTYLVFCQNDQDQTECIEILKGHSEQIFSYFYKWSNKIRVSKIDFEKFQILNNIFRIQKVGEAILEGLSEKSREILIEMMSQYEPAYQNLSSHAWVEVLTVYGKYRNLEPITILYYLSKHPYNTPISENLVELFNKVGRLLEYGEVGFKAFIEYYEDFHFVSMLYKSYLKNPSKHPWTLKFIEMAVRQRIHYEYQPLQTFIESLKLTYESPLSNLDLMTSSHIINLEDLFQQFNPEFYYHSEEFKKFYFNIPKEIRIRLIQNQVTFQLEMIEYQQKKQQQKSSDSNNNCQIVLPNILFKKILVYIYQDNFINSQFKLSLSTISKVFFELCSSIVPMMWSYGVSVDLPKLCIPIYGFEYVRPHNEFCLIKSWPKLMNFDDFQYVPIDDFDKAFYENLECLITSSDCYPILKNTNIQSISMDDSKFGNYLDLFLHSPLLERISFVASSNWEDITFDILNLQLPNLQYLTINALEIDFIQMYIDKIKLRVIDRHQSQNGSELKFPWITLLVKQFNAFSGVDQCMVKLHQSHPTHVELYEFFKLQFSRPETVKDLKSLEIKIMDVTYLIPILLLTETLTLSHLGFKITKIDYQDTVDINENQLKLIFQKISSMPYLKSFSLSYSPFKDSLDDPVLPIWFNAMDKWNMVDLGNFQSISDNRFINFIRKDE
ncbi:hypothetical protein DLAC_02124 [Tieghemostelium lacteum]|uniref:Uncharacterized protein n=1 Tax=Tieghemostelium lacteum TaxID=361077 RepID=A0A152A4M1_TIELA|nr:hypothetical protein DLAC_02124 [Tieghemostelium lacteum]|eukprot:KYR01037.1 hypothetical protein DLAC_02124 [Tieghemostelium lacteum]